MFKCVESMAWTSGKIRYQLHKNIPDHRCRYGPVICCHISLKIFQIMSDGFYLKIKKKDNDITLPVKVGTQMYYYSMNYNWCFRLQKASSFKPWK